MRAHSIVSSKGQIVIPANLRKRYGLKEGTTICPETSETFVPGLARSAEFR